MSRISIDLSDEEHQQLEAMAALQGMTIKEFVLASTLGSDEGKAFTELEGLLRLRAAQVDAGQVSSRSVEQIFAVRINTAGSDQRV